VALAPVEVVMTRDEITQAVVAAKLERGLSWQDLADLPGLWTLTWPVDPYVARETLPLACR
jgi:cyanate lyase